MVRWLLTKGAWTTRPEIAPRFRWWRRALRKPAARPARTGESMDAGRMPLGMPPPDLWLLDPMLPARLAELRDRHTSWTPEMKLMAAVLEDAVCTFYRCVRSRTGPKRLLFLETAEWLESI